MSVETRASDATEVTISGSIPAETAQHLQRLAEQEGLTVSEIVERAVEEYVQCQRFPGILFVTGGSGRRKAVLREGGSIWGIVFNALAIYYVFAKPWTDGISTEGWRVWLSVTCVIVVLLGVLVFFVGNKRSANI